MAQIGRLLVAALACAGTVMLSAQSRPDFAGRWTTDPDPAIAAAAGGARPGGAPRAGGGGQGGRVGDMGSGWGSTITVVQTADKLTVQYAFFGRGDMQPPLLFTYALNGSETRNSVMMGQGTQVQTSKTTWDGDALVITTIHTFTDPSTGKAMPVEVKQRLSLESPTSLVVETTRAGVLGGPSSTTKTTYRKI